MKKKGVDVNQMWKPVQSRQTRHENVIKKCVKNKKSTRCNPTNYVLDARIMNELWRLY